MNSQAVARILLVVTLIAAAHIIKPFSVKKLTRHLLDSTESLVYLLPASARSRFDQANQLALAFGHSLFETGEFEWNRSTPAAAGAEVATVNTRPSCPSSVDTDRPAIKAAPAPVKARTRPQVLAKRSSVEKSAPDSSRTGQTDRMPEAEGSRIIDEIASSMVLEVDASAPLGGPNQTDMPATRVFKSSMPVVLPIIRLKLNYSPNPLQPLMIYRLWKKPFAFTIEMQYLQKRFDCDQGTGNQETKESRFIALLDEAEKSSKMDSPKPGKSMNFHLKCENDAKEAVIEERSVPSPEKRTLEATQSEPLTFPLQTPQFDDWSIQP